MPVQITLHTTETTASPLDLWHLEIDASDTDESFAVTSEEDETSWSVSVQGEAALAQQSLAQRLQEMDRRQAAISLAGEFLQAIDVPTTEDVTFILGEAEEVTEAEAILFQTLACYSAPDLEESFAPAWFGRWRAPVEKVQQTLTGEIKEFQQFMQQAVELLKPTVHIETQVAQVLLAHTVVRPNGKMETTWQGNITPTQMQLHHQTTQLTLETRRALMLFLAQISAGAASLATKFYITQWVALPTAFRFVQDVAWQTRQDKLLTRMAQLRERKAQTR